MDQTPDSLDAVFAFLVAFAISLLLVRPTIRLAVRLGAIDYPNQRSLHEEPTEIATWPDPRERRRMTDGMVFTVEPFLSMGAQWAEGGNDDWTLYSDPRAPTVQYEHTVVVTRGGPLVVTLPG